MLCFRYLPEFPGFTIYNEINISVVLLSDVCLEGKLCCHYTFYYLTINVSDKMSYNNNVRFTPGFGYLRQEEEGADGHHLEHDEEFDGHRGGQRELPGTNIRMQPRKVTKVLHMGLELWDREEENPEGVDLLEVFLGIFPRKDIRVETVEVVFHMDLEL